MLSPLLSVPLNCLQDERHQQVKTALFYANLASLTALQATGAFFQKFKHRHSLIAIASEQTEVSFSGKSLRKVL
ncbi:hypothetical protein [Alteriqipengyuania lutimaris]|uniref:hypothetical protein n=1 Tax=Alteriqipengyuania lutimaris TaxID=1538146 RepID=UPI0011C07291|nr:hypothetical protein [Alteriqipengyuania lutimaris]MBB3033152.1 hypothetical protein [Alteriqipengyuania lutimaris]